MPTAKTQRIILWTTFAINLLASIVYLVLAMTSFHNVQKGVKRLGTGGDKDTLYAYKNALLASCMLSFLIVLFFNAMALGVLIFRAVQLMYGYCLGISTHTAFFLLLSGLTLNAANDTASAFKNSGVWSGTQYQAYQATFGLAYFLVATHLIMFLVLLLTRGGLLPEEEISGLDKYKTEMGTTQQV